MGCNSKSSTGVGKEDKMTTFPSHIIAIDTRTGRPPSEERLAEYCQELQRQAGHGIEKRKRDITIIRDEDLYRVLRYLFESLQAPLDFEAAVQTYCKWHHLQHTQRVRQRLRRLCRKLKYLDLVVRNKREWIIWKGTPLH